MSAECPDSRIGILYLAPWISYGGSDTGTLDWFRHIDRERFAPSLITTQPSANERLAEVYPYAEEVWALPEFLGGQHMPSFVFDLIHTRGIRLVHVMNSRLGFELIADMAALPNPPGVVVQLHVEEPDRSGYVRYVTTRYGNLVDAFSVSSEHLAQTLYEDYNTSRSKLFVIPTGVDAEEAFDPKRVRPIEAVRQEGFKVLFPGRLVEQKDPLLMVDVVRRIAEARDDVHVYVVGDGPLKPDVEALVRAHGLEGNITFHPSSRELARWYAACDLLLMTSVFEGVPYVVYEAMAMATPIVAPALPGNCELMGDTAGLLVDPRDDAAAYAHAVCRLADDSPLRERLAHGARRRVSESFTLQGMARAHEALYDDVLRDVTRRIERAPSEPRCPQAPIPTIWDGPPACGAAHAAAEPVRLAGRPIGGQPLVSVIVPCYNHGRYLPECLNSILAQDYPALEVVVVDDASTEDSTNAVLVEIESRERVTVVRQSQNAGPSVARNRGIAVARGRYILPVDSDNLLLPGAITSMVEQLQSAGEQVGFIYPNCQYFGTRDDYFQPPSYNLHLLMRGNYCDTCSLIDRAVFDAGIEYAEDILLGHEDWDFALTLASHGIRGEPAREPTLRYRKEGFTRSDAVEYRRHSFHEEISERHPELYGTGDPAARYGRYWAPAVDIKARWAPAISIVLSAPCDLAGEEGRTLLERLERQTCRDFEVVLECDALPTPAARTQLRRLPPGLCPHTTARLQEGLALARGPYLLLAGDALVEMVAEPGCLERLVRTMLMHTALEAVAYTDAARHSEVPHALLTSEQVTEPAHALFVKRSALSRGSVQLRLDAGIEVESIARALSVGGIAMQWRHAPRAAGAAPNPPPERLDPDGVWLQLPDSRRERDPHRAYERKQLAEQWPVIPALPWDAIRRWLGLDSWIPPETELLTRHREIGGERRVVCQGAKSPPGYELEFHLGAIQRFSPPGTARLICTAEGDLRTVPRGSTRSDDDEELGHLEQAPLPLLNSLERAVMPDGSVTLISTPRDPLRARAVETEWLGFIEGYPNEPVRPPDARFPTHGRAHLLRGIDRARRRHLYRALRPGGEVDERSTVGELGALHLTAEPGSIPVWIDRDGRVHTDRYGPSAATPEIRELVRWVGAPAGWRGFGRASGRARAVLRRGSQAAAIGLATRRGHPAASNGAGAQTAAAAVPPPVDGELVGYLYPEPRLRRHELFAAVHPITGDQLLTLHPLEAADMGYGPAVALGYVLADLPLTGTLAMRRVAVPWASRFGLEVRRG